MIQCVTQDLCFRMAKHYTEILLRPDLLSAISSVLSVFHFKSNRIVIVGLKNHQ